MGGSIKDALSRQNSCFVDSALDLPKVIENHSVFVLFRDAGF